MKSKKIIHTKKKKSLSEAITAKTIIICAYVIFASVIVLGARMRHIIDNFYGFAQNSQTVQTTASLLNTNPHCQLISGTGLTRVLLIPYNFSSADEFKTYTTQAISNVNETNLGISLNYLTFIAYHKFDGDYGCHDGVPFDGGRQFGCTDENAIREAMSQCGANNALIIANVPGLGAYSKKDGTTALKVGTISYAAHELGHAIVKLDDEYDFKKNTTRTDTGRNCSATSPCQWSSSNPLSSCIPTCGYRNWFRSSEKSVMNKDANKNTVWNEVSIKAWEDVIKYNQAAYRAAADTQTQRQYHQTLYVSLLQDSLSNLTLEDMEIRNAYPINLDQNLVNHYYTVKMYDTQSRLLYTGQLSSLDRLVSEEGGTIEIMRTQINMHLPYYTTLAKVEIYDQQNISKLTIDLRQNELVIPKPYDSLCGNGLCDAVMGEDRTTCDADCRPENEYRQDYKEFGSDINHDGRVTILDCTMCLQQYNNASTQTSCNIVPDNVIDSLDYSTCINSLGR